MQKKRVCLIFPNQRWIKNDHITTWNLNPTTLALLGAMIKDKFDVKIIDAQFYNMSKEIFLDELKNRVRLYGIINYKLHIFIKPYQISKPATSYMSKSMYIYFF